MEIEAFRLIEEAFERVDAGLPVDADSNPERAREAVSSLADEGGYVSPVDDSDLAPRKVSFSSLGAWDDDPWDDATYGVDSSTTQPMEYNNGLIANAAYAKIAATGDADPEIERKGTVEITYYYKGDAEIPSTLDESSEIDVNITRLPESEIYETRRLEKTVSAVAQKNSESTHVLGNIDSIDSILFIDGPIYPTQVLRSLDFSENRAFSVADVLRKIAERYVRVVEHQYERGLPVVGIVKTSNSSTLIRSLEDKTDDEVLWNKDNQLIGEALRDESSIDYIPYTPWFVEEKVVFDSGEAEVLSPVEDSLDYDIERYRRSFFYYRLPSLGTVMRADAPYMVVDTDEKRRKVRAKVLKEAAKKRDVPRAVMRADKNSKITRENRDKIKRAISAGYYTDYNDDVRYETLDEDEGGLL
ncbi:MAG: DNA double-strand break repair nuclease NurA [Halobacteria archaeon]|nr:DNA double-strand break repair nuclease NurA [Halobacteria archaeon]